MKFLRPPHLIEREEAFRYLAELLQESVHGKGSATVVGGPTGSGKTAVLHTLADWAAAAGCLFLGASGSRTETAQPYGVLQQLLTGTSLRLTENPRADPRAGHGLCMEFIRLSEQQPILIGIDDVDNADSPSLQFLLYLARRITSARIMIVLNDATLPQPSSPFFHAEMLRQPHCHRINLGLLSTDGVRQLVQQELTRQVPGKLAADIHALSGGNPLLVHGILEDQKQSASAQSGQLSVGRGFSQALLDCLYRGDTVTIQVAHAIAVLGPHARTTTVSRLTGLEMQPTTRIIASLNRSGLLDGNGFRHPVARTTVLNNVQLESHADIRRQAAELLHEEGAAPTAVAEQLIAARLAEAPWAVSALVDAAEAALARGQVALAVEQLKLAHRSSVDTRQQTGIRMTLAVAEWRLNPAATARHLDELTAAAREGQLEGRHAIALSRLLLWHGVVDEAIDVLDHHTDPAGDRVTPGRDDWQTLTEARTTQLWLSYIYPSLATRVLKAEKVSLAGESSQLVQCNRMVIGLGSLMSSRGSDRAVTGAEQILQSSILDDITFGPIVAALTALIYAGHLQTALRWQTSLYQDASAAGVPMWQAALTAIRAEIAIRQGDPRMTLEQGRKALAQVPFPGWGVVAGGPIATLVLAATAVGDHNEAARLLSQPMPEAMFLTPFGLHWLYARGQHRLAIGRPHAAVGDFQTCGGLMRNWGIDNPAIVPWRSGAAEAWLRMGQADKARQLLEEQIGRLSADDARTLAISTRLLAATEDRGARSGLLHQAAEAFRQCGDLLGLAQTMAAIQEPSFPPKQAPEAEPRPHGGSTSPHPPTTSRPPRRTDLDRIKLDTSGPGAPEFGTADRRGGTTLSHAESRVARLAARGLPNREIASKLFITVSTVEQHLTRIYRKLKVNRREDLPQKMPAELADIA